MKVCHSLQVGNLYYEKVLNLCCFPKEISDPWEDSKYNSEHLPVSRKTQLMILLEPFPSLKATCFWWHGPTSCSSFILKTLLKKNLEENAEDTDKTDNYQEEDAQLTKRMFPPFFSSLKKNRYIRAALLY